ncbi:hypothetical protein B7P43_G11147 [Cryptotermes secundus]|uniref:Uncharacterized protein n=1 Tax=Cryptotermes secundus TaxID=105785 RepID=A0A2J7QBC3_9NEOP|nr:hypothetical protein B7P43_G11147 [Cryptotermes secundus]
MMVSFDIRGIVHIDWVREGQTVNQVYYKEVLIILCEHVRRRPEMWKKDSWILHHDYVPAYNTVSQDISGEAQDPCVGTSILLI